MIEYHTVDLEDTVSGIVAFSEFPSPIWSGLLVLAPDERIRLPEGSRHDLYVLKGSVTESAEQRTLHVGDFGIRFGGLALRAGSQGGSVLASRETVRAGGANFTACCDDRPWRQSRTPGMTVATLNSDEHALNLVMWQPGTVSRRHTHPGGEEIFVIRGELCEDAVRHPAGTWLRLHAGAYHAPFVEKPTLLLIRCGHLTPRRCAAAPAHEGLSTSEA